MKSLKTNNMSFVPQKGDIIELSSEKGKASKEPKKFKVIKRIVPLLESSDGINISLNTVSIILKEIKPKKKKTAIEKLSSKLGII